MLQYVMTNGRRTDSTHSHRVLKAVEDGDAAKKTFVEASWARSKHLHKLSPDDRCDAETFEDKEVRLRRDREGRLLNVGQGTLDRLHATLRLAGCGIILTDKDGVILESRVASSDLDTFENSGLRIGGNWSERSQGTNGIGTSIAEGRATSIIREQHFRSTNTTMSCFGAPVFGTDGTLIAILDISSCRSDLDKAYAALIEQMVADAAAKLEQDHFCDAFSQHRIVRVRNDLDNGGALLAVNADDLVVGATRKARHKYGLELGSPLAPLPASDLLGDAQARGIGFECAERRELKRALVRTNGNASEAARSLGISRATFYRRVEKACGGTPDDLLNS